MKKNILQLVLCFVLMGVVLLTVPGCSGAVEPDDNTSQSQQNDSQLAGDDTDGKLYAGGVSRNLMENVVSGNVVGKEIDDAFIQNQMKLGLELFQLSVAETPDKNTMISPLSIQLALAMTANGAAGNTKVQMEQVLAGNHKIEDLNKYLYTYVNGLPNAENYKVNIANSIWFRDDDAFQVEPEFLQVNADYYNAQVNASPFDENTVTDINNWVNKNTDGMIPSLLDEIPNTALMYLINAICFDAQWETAYRESSVCDSKFTTFDGSKQDVEMMYSSENLYIQDGKATGFIKQYKDEKYSFVALLPNETGEEAFYEYVEGLTPKKIQYMLKNVQRTEVETGLPKFTSEYTLTMNSVLSAMGMQDAFTSAADFSKLGHASDNIYIGSVLHKTFIEVDEQGTKAAAVTSVEVECEAAISNIVILNRPFVYMIIDNETNLPLFIGTLITFDDAK